MAYYNGAHLRGETWPDYPTPRPLSAPYLHNMTPEETSNDKL